MVSDLVEVPSGTSRRETEAAAPGGHFIAGNALRAIAAVSVVTYHVAFGTNQTLGRGTPAEFDQFGPLGVVLRNLDLGLYIFFVLSGYLIARPFVRAFVVGDAHPRLRPYLRNRALRVLPAFWAIFTILLIRNGSLGSSVPEIASVYGFAQIYTEPVAGFLVGPAWTLDVEVAFYLLIPLAAWLVLMVGGRLPRRHRHYLVAGVLLAVWLAALAASEVGPETLKFQRSPLAMLFAFVPGVFLALVEVPVLAGRSGRLPRHLALGTVSAGVAALIACVVVTGEKFGFAPDNGAAPRAFASIGAGLLVAAPLCLQWRERRCWRLLDNGVMDWIGRHSYSIYLLHTGLAIEVTKLVDPRGGYKETFVIWMLVLTPLLLLASALSYRLFEAPFLRRRRGWRA